MVDYDPFSGNYSGTVVRNNTIMGGFAAGPAEAGEAKGVNSEDAIIKYVVAVDRTSISFLTTISELESLSALALGSVIGLALMSANLARSWTTG
jgi:hypothetical protein